VKGDVYMKIKFLILILIYFISGCSSLNKISENNLSNNVFEKNKEIIIRTGVIPGNLNIIGVKDQYNFYCFNGDNRQEVYLFHVPDGTISRISCVISPKKYIKAITINEKWIVWVEDEVKIEGVDMVKSEEILKEIVNEPQIDLSIYDEKEIKPFMNTESNNWEQTKRFVERKHK
jgi:hypothetical protein